jgi:peptide/nickel transport system substrate-binding protein
MATRIAMVLLGLTLILAVACGGAPAAPETTAAPATDPTAAPIESATSQPTSTPQVAAPPSEVEVNPGKLTIMVGDFSGERFDNVYMGGQTGSGNYLRIMGGYLISDNERKEMVPGIATQWSLSDDGLTWTFTIREGVKFHDGSELTPEDVLWSLQHYFGSQAVDYTLASSGAAIARAMNSIELSGPDEVSVTTSKPVAELLVLVAEAGDDYYPVMPKRAKVHDIEEELAFDNNPLGAGFMKLVSRTPASVMSFERFNDFYYQPENGFPEDKRVKFQSLDLFLVPEEATRVSAIRAGEADIAPASLATKQQVEAGGGRLVFGPEGAFVDVKLMGCYELQYPCHDKRVRQALDYAIDKELIRDRLYGGAEIFQVKGWSVVTPSTIGYSPDLDPWPFDPDKARQLLADAGYPEGEGFGKLIVNTLPATSLPLQVEAAQLAADMWRRELGIDVEVRVGDRTGLKEKEIAGELKGQVLWRDNETRKEASTSYDNSYGNPDYDRRLHEDPELFSLVQETMQVLDPVKRAEASNLLFQRLRDESYNLGIGYVSIPWAVGSRVETWEPYPLALYPSALHTITLK